MKALEITKYSFLIIGTVLIATSTIGFVRTRSFVDTAIGTEGFVIGLDEYSSSSGSSNSSGHRTSSPLIEFQMKDGRSVTFQSSSENSSEHYNIGEGVQILYDRNNPKHAEIDNFSHLWADLLIVGGLGIPFLAIGFGLLMVSGSKSRKRSRLIQNGVRITTQFHKLEQNAFIEVNGQHPYQILTTWKNPKDAEQHIFRSDNIWEDPTVFIPEKINVFIERDNPRDYHVDLSFLPLT